MCSDDYIDSIIAIEVKLLAEGLLGFYRRVVEQGSPIPYCNCQKKTAAKVVVPWG
jgi:hypothetical protein